MTSTTTITPSQKTHFDTQGFLILRASEHNAVDPPTLQRWADEVSNLPREAGKWMPYDEMTSTGERQIMRTENFAPYHEGFNALLFGATLRSILAQVTGEEMLLFKDKINYKLPGGNGFGAHLDAPAYNHVGQIEHTTANLAVDAALTVGADNIQEQTQGRVSPHDWTHGISEQRKQWLLRGFESGDPNQCNTFSADALG